MGGQDSDVNYEYSEENATNDDSDCDDKPAPKRAAKKTVPGRLTLTCDWVGCGKVFHKHKYMECHYMTHTGERPFVCKVPDCQKAYIKKCHLMRHEKAHDPGTPRFGCPSCNQTFSLKSNLTRHVNRTHNEARFKCTFEGCDLQFKKNFQLKHHINQSHEQAPLMCPHEGCSKTLAHSGSLKRHLKMHEGYRCKEEGCDVDCKTWSEMRHHVRTSHRPVHKCEVCGKTFQEKCRYTVHIQSHSEEREYKPCPYDGCHRSYLDQRNLNFHINVFHKKQKCSVRCTHEGCNTVLASKAVLKTHLKKMHDPAYIEQREKLRKIALKKRKKKQRKKKAKEGLIALAGKETEMKHIATSRQEIDNVALGTAEREFVLAVINHPKKPKLLDFARGIAPADTETSSVESNDESETLEDESMNSETYDSDDDLDQSEIQDSETEGANEGDLEDIKKGEMTDICKQTTNETHKTCGQSAEETTKDQGDARENINSNAADTCNSITDNLTNAQSNDKLQEKCGHLEKLNEVQTDLQEFTNSMKSPDNRNSETDVHI